MMMWGWDHGWGLLTWITMSIGMLAFWALVVLGIVLVVRQLSSGGREPSGEAERILARRFASGEIDENEYRSRLEALRSSGR